MTDGAWQQLWNARLAGLEGLFGKSDPDVQHAVVPFELGYEAGGGPDYVTFSNHKGGVLFVSAELTGESSQLPSAAMGQYELAMLHRGEEDWHSRIQRGLAYYSLKTVIEPGHTMDLGPLAPGGSEISALLFVDYGRFKLNDKSAGVLLLVGITQHELAMKDYSGAEVLVDTLKEQGVFPFTDWWRQSTV
ncbi:MAG: suppressor of fused domain protein [Planctomycetes bacterium]|nr:suppressor of fused domain protein [Planctomycetota bacterium]